MKKRALCPLSGVHLTIKPNFSLLGALYDTIYYVSFATLCEKLMCSVVKGQLIGELAIRCACCWAFRG